MYALNVIVAENQKAYDAQKKPRCFVCGIKEDKAFLMKAPEGKVCVKCNCWVVSVLPAPAHFLYGAFSKNGNCLSLSRDAILAELQAQAQYVVILDEFSPEVYGGYPLM